MFPCSGCGVCCQNISTVNELKDYDLGNGICKYFDLQSKLCIIYDNRPDICQVDKMYGIKYHIEYSKKEFYKLNADSCNNMQDIFNIDKSYRIKVGD
jgi:Fe-S-cluster containining protein